MENAKRIFCPECEIRSELLKITPQKMLDEVLSQPFVEGFSTPLEEFKRRLSICKTCPSLRENVLCAECGSFVAYRAHILKNTCPFPFENKWETSKNCNF